MFKLHRKVEYALIALKHMSQKRPGELTTAKEVADAFGCPFDATARVMQIMAHKGLLKSEQGAFGGYQITRDLAKVTVFELWSGLLGTVALAKCTSDHEEESCELKGTCNIITPIHILNAKLVQFFKNMSVLDLLVANQSSHSSNSLKRFSSPDVNYNG